MNSEWKHAICTKGQNTSNLEGCSKGRQDNQSCPLQSSYTMWEIPVMCPIPYY